MNANPPRDLNAGEWLANQHVADCLDHVRLRSGFWYTDLKLPVASDLSTCRTNHWIYAPFRYERFFASREWLTLLDEPLPELRDGILHLGSASHYHYILHGIGNLSREMLREASTLYVDFDYSDDQVSFLREVVSTLTSTDINVVRVPQGIYRVTNVLVPVNRRHHVRVNSVKRSLDQLDVTSGRPRQRLYVTRRNAVSRRLINEDDFVEKIRNVFEFRVIENESLSLKEQLIEYSNAEFVAGPHGAGLTNIIFSRNPRALLELWHSTPQPFFKGLSRELNISYLAARGTPMSTGGALDDRRDNRDFVIDPKLALRGIELMVTKSSLP